MNNFEEYMDSVYSQLTDNATDEYKNEYVTYIYTTDQVDAHRLYFNSCMLNGLSPYKALLFFADYLEEERNMNEKAQRVITTEQIIGELNHQIDVCQSRNEPLHKTSWNEDDMNGVLITQNMAMEIVYELEKLKDYENI